MGAKGKYFNDDENGLKVGVPFVIFVEGPDDAYFLERILGQIGATPDQVLVEIMGGKGGAAKALKEYKKNAYYVRGIYRHVCVIRDADNDVGVAEAEVNAAYQQTGLPSPGNENIVVYDHGKSVALYLLPGGGNIGDLESLCLKAVDGGARYAVAKQCFDTANAEIAPLDRSSKRIAQIYMAIHPEDCRGVGRAFQKNAFPDGPVMDPIRAFIGKFLSQP